MHGFLRRVLVSAGVLGMVAGCERSGPAGTATQPGGGTVVVYTALDRQFSEPILAEFGKQTGIRAEAVWDTEATKTVGLANRIRSEANRPRCDVFWNNEILNTLRLKQEGLLQPCRAAHAEDYPAEFRDPNGYWYGFAARARVIIANMQQVKADEMPRSVRDLADPRWRGRCGIAKPLFGTTASHVACLFVKLGPNPARDLLRSWKENDIKMLGGNKACAEMVARGELSLALTDTDDAIIERDAGRPVQIIFPDSAENEMGTLVLPNTLALVKDCPHPEAGRRLIDYLLSPEVEARLAGGPSAQIPLNAKTAARSRVGSVGTDLRPTSVDFVKAAESFPDAARFVEAEFLPR